MVTTINPNPENITHKGIRHLIQPQLRPFDTHILSLDLCFSGAPDPELTRHLKFTGVNVPSAASNLEITGGVLSGIARAFGFNHVDRVPLQGRF